jgi:GNAT superfamily N-acetyltransferase
MRKIHVLLAAGGDPANVSLRRHRPGDMGWIVSRHGALYRDEYGWDQRFEGMVAGIVATLLERVDDTSEACWIAELDGERVGSIALAREDDETGRLRLLLVEPAARGYGVGRRLVRECLEFARAADYRRMVLSTFSILAAARHLYAEAGFRIAATEPMSCFGQDDLIEETWELQL